MNERENGLSPDQLRAVKLLAGAESEGADVAGSDPETAAEWLRDDPQFIAGLNRAKSFRRERLRAEVRSLASDAMATLRELVSGPDVAPAVRLRASLAILQAADALKVEEIGPMSAEGVEAKLEHDRFLQSLGG
jgi:5'-3' exonuclease